MHSLKNHPKNPEGIEPGDTVKYVGSGGWTPSFAAPHMGREFAVHDIVEFCGILFVYPKELHTDGAFSNPSDYIHAFKLVRKANHVLTGAKAVVSLNGKKVELADVSFSIEKVAEEIHVHQWKEYVGIMNRFRYCEVCNAKESA